jgi:hypothetical protein
MSDEGQRFFRCHDAAHFVFGRSAGITLTFVAFLASGILALMAGIQAL